MKTFITKYWLLTSGVKYVFLLALIDTIREVYNLLMINICRKQREVDIVTICLNSFFPLKGERSGFVFSHFYL